MISAGGDSRIIGDREGRPWIIGIQHPRDPAGIALRLPLSDSAPRMAATTPLASGLGAVTW